MSKATPLKLVSERSPQREALAAAIANAERAEADAKAAREAAVKARDRKWEVDDRLEALRQQHQAAPISPAEAYIAATRAGHDVGLAELEAPTKARAAAEADLQREIDALTKTRHILEEAASNLGEVISATKRKVEEAVAEVLRSEVDAAPLLAEAEAAQSVVVKRRCALIQLASLLPHGEEKAKIDRFLGRQWLSAVGVPGFAHHPAAQAIAASREALMRDADAALGV
jgi:hypothetical protein